MAPMNGDLTSTAGPAHTSTPTLSPALSSRLRQWGTEIHTFSKMWHKNIPILTHQFTFSGDTYSSENIISCTHDSSYPCISKLSENACSGGLEFVFEYDESEKCQS